MNGSEVSAFCSFMHIYWYFAVHVAEFFAYCAGIILYALYFCTPIMLKIMFT